MVAAQVKLIDHLGIDQLFCAMGGSMGGMQVLKWRQHTRTACFAAVPIATASRHSARTSRSTRSGARRSWPIRTGAAAAISSKTSGRSGIGGRPHGGPYHLPVRVALHRKFGRNLQDRKAISYGFDADFQVESYLRHQGASFVERFDANSYLYITRATDYFDLAAEHGGRLAEAFAARCALCVISFTSDWLYPTRKAGSSSMR